MTTKEVEQMLGLSKQTLIYYEREGFIKPSRDSNNYRNYSMEDIDILKYIQLLRSMDLSIDDIKLIMEGKLSLRKALEVKKEYIEKEKIELDDIDNRIKEYIKRRKVKISFDNEPLEQWAEYETLFFNENHVMFNDIYIELEDIECIEISMFSYAGLGGIRVFNMRYFIDLDIHCKNDTYSFEIMNNNQVRDMFAYFDMHKLNMKDILNLKQIYNEKRDMVQLNNYINYHFNQWAKQYHLDNPRYTNIGDSLKSAKDMQPHNLTFQKFVKELYKNPFKKK